MNGLKFKSKPDSNMNIALKAEKREILGKKVKASRKKGRIPAQVYGKKFENINIFVDAKELDLTLRAAGRTQLIDIEIDGGKKIPALARNVDFDMSRKNVTHLDFYAVDMTAITFAKVPVVAVGESPAVNLGGILVNGLSIIQVEALPADIPEVIEIDITPLEGFSDNITIADVVFPKGVTAKTSIDSVVFSVQEPRALAAKEEEMTDADTPEDTAAETAE